MLARFTLLFLSIISIASSAPATTLDHFDSGHENHTADITSMKSVSARWQPGEFFLTVLEAGETHIGNGHLASQQFSLVTCKPNKILGVMCQLAYIEKSDWGGWGIILLYDNLCNERFMIQWCSVVTSYLSLTERSLYIYYIMLGLGKLYARDKKSLAPKTMIFYTII
ncbi:hypothetical protein WAI453_001498 [Rhynchosporium graminicola]